MRIMVNHFLMAMVTALMLCLLAAVPAFADENADVSALHVEGIKIKDASGNSVQLTGVSTHGINFPDMEGYVNEDGFRTLRDTWGVNVIRLAMYTEEYGGYCSTPSNQAHLLDLIDKGVRACQDLGMYVIIDWHVMNQDPNPNTHKAEALKFFDAVAAKYASVPNVLYEICNEPNSGTTMADIKSYADDVVPVIRKHTKAVVIVGTPTWSQDVDQVKNYPLKDTVNVMYALHFYAATHKEWLRDKAEKALEDGVPLFISECNVCDASGNGSIDRASADAWGKLIKKYDLSFCVWSLSHKEAASIFKQSCDKTSGFTEADLSDTGSYLLKFIKTISKSKKPSKATGRFSDVPNDMWYFDPVEWAVAKGITSGTSLTSFSPSKPCTRAELVAFLWRAEGKPEPSDDTGSFQDVAENAWYSDPVAWAVEREITSGTTKETFSPDRICKRCEIVTFLMRAQGGSSADEVSHFSDVSNRIKRKDGPLSQGLIRLLDDHQLFLSRRIFM